MSNDPITIFGDLPFGRRLGEDGRKNYVGSIGDGLDVNTETLEVARRNWREAPAGDFERTGNRTWRDGAGVEYRRIHGVPLFGDGAPTDVDVFIVSDNRFIFMRRADRAEGETRTLGSITAHAATGRERIA